MENPDGEGPHSLINYLKNGLRNIPLEPLMLYNFAVAHERVGCDAFALLFFKFARLAKLNWVDAWFGEAVTNFKLKLFEQSSQAIEMANKVHKMDAIVEKEVLLYF